MAVPVHNGLGANEVEVSPPLGPSLRDHHPEVSIPIAEPWSPAPSFQDPHLVFEDENSQGHCPAGSKGTEKKKGEGLEDEDYAGKLGKRSWKFKRGRAEGSFGMVT